MPYMDSSVYTTANDGITVHIAAMFSADSGCLQICSTFSLQQVQAGSFILLQNLPIQALHIWLTLQQLAASSEDCYL